MTMRPRDILTSRSAPTDLEGFKARLDNWFSVVNTLGWYWADNRNQDRAFYLTRTDQLSS